MTTKEARGDVVGGESSALSDVFQSIAQRGLKAEELFLGHLVVGLNDGEFDIPIGEAGGRGAGNPPVLDSN